MGAAEEVARRRQVQMQAETQAAIARVRAEEEAKKAEIQTEAKAAIERLEAKGFPGAILGVRSRNAPGWFSKRTINTELACWPVYYETWYDEHMPKPGFTTLWSDGQIDIPPGMSTDARKQLLASLRSLGT